MATNNFIFSNANNFPEHLVTGIDVRTGMYTINIKIGDFLSHKMTGLALPISLSYIASSAHDIGFGRGWDISLCRFDKSNNVLTLSTGQSFHLEWNGNKNEYDIPYRKLKDIRVLYLAEKREIVVLYKDGRRDYINWDDGVVTRTTSPSGLPVYYEYMYLNNHLALQKIYDGAGRELSIDWRSDPYITTVSHSLDGVTFQQIEFYKEGSGTVQRLISVLFPELPCPLRIRYRYINESTYDVIEEVIHPNGLIEQMSYRDRGHPLPNGAPFLHVPHITKYTLLPGENQPIQSVTYEYSDKNHLGFGSDRIWVAGEDTLFKAERNYKYTVTESVNNTKVTKHTYNKYHLLDSVIYMDSGSIYKEDEYFYYADLDIGIELQPATYSLLRKQITTHYFNGKSRVLTKRYEYDDFANQILVCGADGSCVVRSFYPIAGEGDNCPADPNGMISQLKDEMFIPSTIAHGESSRKTIMTYKSLPMLNNESNYFIVLKSVCDENISATFSHYEDAADYNTYGRVKAQILSINGYKSSSEYVFSFTKVSLKSTKKTMTHDGIQFSSSETTSYLLGKTIEHIGPDGVVNQIKYDAIGRQVKTITAVGLPEQAERCWLYSVGGGNNSITETDSKGNVKITRFNNAGKFIFVETGTPGAPPKVVQSYEYNAIGLLVSQTESDWLNGRRIDVTTSYVHDENGEISEIIHGDGRREFMIQNTVLLTSEYYLSGLMSEKRFFDLSGQEVRKETHDSQGVVIATTDYLYDGYGNLIEVIDTEGRKTSFKYDDFDRLVEITRYIGGQSIRETMTYPSFTNVDKSESIAIDGILMGARRYDGLLRVVEEVAAGTKIGFSYSGAFQSPSQQVTPAGDIVDIAYNIPLQTSISQQVQGEGKLSSIYKYDPITGFLSSHKNIACEHQFERDTMGRVISETIYFNNAESKTATYTYSITGRLLTSQDFIGNMTEYEYDDFLRPWRCSYTQSNRNKIITTTFFDEFSRPCRYVSVGEGRETTVELVMSDIGLEVARNIVVNGEAVYSATLNYNKSQQLDSRVIYDGDAKTTESYEYDELSRLITYRCNGTALPDDGYGNHIMEQSFTHDIYGNVITCISVFSSGESNLSQLEYFSDNPVKLESISNTHPSYPPKTIFQYDAAGNMLNDESGLSYIYDAFGRLASVAFSENDLSLYTYDANDRLVSQTVDNQPVHFYYHSGSLVNEITDNAAACYYHASPGFIHRTVVSDSEIQYQHLYCNTQESVIETVTDNGDEIICESHTYTAYGVNKDEKNNK